MPLVHKADIVADCPPPRCDQDDTVDVLIAEKHWVFGRRHHDLTCSGGRRPKNANPDSNALIVIVTRSSRMIRTTLLRPFVIYNFRTLRPPFNQLGQPVPENEREWWVGRLLRRTASTSNRNWSTCSWETCH